MLLPIEGLFAEVIRRTGLVETLQRGYRVVVAGLTTLWAILHSLQSGFRTEWGKFGELIDAIGNRINQAAEAVEKARAKTRTIAKKLIGPGL